MHNSDYLQKLSAFTRKLHVTMLWCMVHHIMTLPQCSFLECITSAHSKRVRHYYWCTQFGNAIKLNMSLLSSLCATKVTPENSSLGKDSASGSAQQVATSTSNDHNCSHHLQWCQPTLFIIVKLAFPRCGSPNKWQHSQYCKQHIQA